MAHNSESYRPIKFLNQMEQNKHTVMLYDDRKYADIIIARYLQNGLEKGESCIFFTADDPSIVEAMLSAVGIDVTRRIICCGSFPLKDPMRTSLPS
jgi:ferredoxin-NADP reductase